MARPRREDINDVNRRGDLILAAARLFKEKGYHGTSMRDIARAINMQAGSPFYHFASKQDLLFAGVKEGLSIGLAALDAVDAESLAPLDYFRALARTHLAHLLDTQTGVVPLVVHDWRYLEGSHYQEVVALRQRYEKIWLACFSKLRQAGLVRRDDNMACRFFLSALTGVCGWYDPQGPLKSDRIADDLVDWIIFGDSGAVPGGRRMPVRRPNKASAASR